MKKLSTILIVAAFLLVLPLVVKPAGAAVRCKTQYEGEVCWGVKIMIDKKVWDPEDRTFKDNLVGVNDYRFAPGEEITYLLKVTNTGSKKLDKVNVKDYLPEYIEFVSGDLEYEIYDLDVDETVEREFKARVVSEEKLPDREVICYDDDRTLNIARAWIPEETVEDLAKVCLTRKVLGVKELPPTGPEYLFLLLPFSLLTGLVGLYLKKFSL